VYEVTVTAFAVFKLREQAKAFCGFALVLSLSQRLNTSSAICDLGARMS
jgi:hypothetical protein